MSSTPSYNWESAFQDFTADQYTILYWSVRSPGFLLLSSTLSYTEEVVSRHSWCRVPAAIFTAVLIVMLSSSSSPSCRDVSVVGIIISTSHFSRRRYLSVMMFMMSSSLSRRCIPAVVDTILQWRSCGHDRCRPAVALLTSLPWRRASLSSSFSSLPSSRESSDVTRRRRLASDNCPHPDDRPDAAAP